MSEKSLKEVAVKIQGKNYVLVSDRVIYFNETYKNGMIQTKLLSEHDAETVVMMAKVTPDVATPDRYFTGFSQAKWGQGMVNKTAALENCETSAVGRALAMMGIGVIDSIASVDEINKAKTQESPNTPQNDVMERHMSKGQVCKNCGAEMVKNPRTGKWFCKNKCWLHPEKPTADEQYDKDFDSSLADEVADGMPF